MNLQITRLKGETKFKHPLGYTKPTGYCFKTDKGYLSFDGIIPYIPRGGKKALESILAQGGFTDYNNVIWLTPLN